MNFGGVIDKIMSDVQNGSDEPFLIYRDKYGEWHTDYTQNKYGDTFDWVEHTKELDPLAMTAKGSDFSRGSYGFVFDKVLTDRLRNEYHIHHSSGRETDNLASLFCFFEDNIGAFSHTTVDYLTTLERPLAALQEMCPHNMTATEEHTSYNEALADDAISNIEAAVNERQHIQSAPEQNGVDKPEKSNAEPAITAVITNGHSHQRGITISFPTTHESLLAALNVKSIGACRIYDISCGTVPPLVHYLGNGTTLDELQYIAAKITALAPEEREAFSAFLEVPFDTKDITAQHVMDALENIHTYSLDKSIMTEEALGLNILKARLEVCQPAIDTLSSSPGIPERNLVDYIKTMEEHIDAAAFGRAHMEQNDMFLTSKGVMGVDWQDFFWRQDRQVPDEYRVTSNGKPSITQEQETHLENEAKISPAAHLPEGWEWRLYDDGSGGLYSPENKSVVEVDFATSEYRREGKWHFMSGYPHETVSSGEFKESMEKTIRASLEREAKPSLLQTLEAHKAIIAQQPPAEKHKKDETSL